MPKFTEGQSVMILNTKMSGAVFIEGVATIVGVIDDADETYEVIFDGDHTDQRCTRFVDPLAQNKTAQYVARLNDPS